jgi:hypothetical protein
MARIGQILAKYEPTAFMTAWLVKNMPGVPGSGARSRSPDVGQHGTSRLRFLGLAHAPVFA